MSILDQIIDRSARPSILSRQDDLGQIGVDTSSVDDSLRALAGGWDASEYGISAAEVAQRIAAADTPESRERLLADLRARAVRRANLDTSTGTVAVLVAGAALRDHWHRLGVSVDRACSSSEVIDLVPGLRFGVVKVPAQYVDQSGTLRSSDDTYILYRDDTGAPLSSAGRGYRPVQTADGFGALDEVLQEFGARYETAGAIDGGRKVWMQAILPSGSFELPGGDKNDQLATLVLPHVCGESAEAFATSRRVVCANTLRQAMGGAKSCKIRHTGDIKTKLGDMRTAFGMTVKAAASYRGLAEAAYRAPLDAREMAECVLDDICEISTIQARLIASSGPESILDATIQMTDLAREKAAKHIARAARKRAGILDDIMDRYESDRCRPRGTAWAGLQAVTESANHGKWGKERGEGQDDRRLLSVLSGERDLAMQSAVDYVSNALVN